MHVLKKGLNDHRSVNLKERQGVAELSELPSTVKRKKLSVTTSRPRCLVVPLTPLYKTNNRSSLMDIDRK